MRKPLRHLAIVAAVALQPAACSLVPAPLTEEQAVARVTEEFGFSDVTVVSVDAGLAGDLHRGVPNSYASQQEIRARGRAVLALMGEARADDLLGDRRAGGPAYVSSHQRRRWEPRPR